MLYHRKLNTKEAAEYLHLQPGTLEVWRCMGRGPSYAKLGRKVIYDIADLDCFVRQRRVMTIDSMPEYPEVEHE